MIDCASIICHHENNYQLYSGKSTVAYFAFLTYLSLPATLISGRKKLLQDQ